MTAGEHIGKLAAELIEHVEAEYPNATVGAAAIVCDVLVRDDETTRNPIIVGCSDPRRWVQLALLQEAVEVAEVMNDERVSEAADD